ncbi:putative G-protein beta WD-40 repeat-containing protein [Talaromyces proteolyticus]|uniref:G-protein beta WD-40 repeat-containing protein n=1 Tax=Talaromyces proteolyticus TaxID=1131652 RepID=A0AAD4KJU5_9EURO|nr:putative G-protein beta WD-40 repeat-containing protein [Talaromyces proteolyticus]KAH8690887.1 putative G-protein beta WD-40 repeat-containing protein [Talaromyces proteolyticus]
MDTTRQFVHGDYTVGWICALPDSEFVAAAAMLDEEHPMLPAADLQDTNSYLLGKIGNHNVVIACLPAERIGKVSAATVASNMLRSFPAIRFGLMVGVGGGVPPDRNNNGVGEEKDSEEESEDVQDVRLGDVVISLHSESSEAVIQYDFGKSMQQKKFIRTGGKLDQPPAIVLNGISTLKQQHRRKGHKILELITEAISKNPGIAEEFRYPGLAKDRLFKPEVVHVEGKRSCKACCGPDSKNLVQREDRLTIAPKVHYGTIGSADQLMKDAILRNELAREKGILCFEMEAAGLMNSFRCLVIRGICDYADTHKNKIWQPYAAATAAAYAKELLLVIPGQGVINLPLIEKKIVKGLENLSKNTHYINQKLDLRNLKVAKGAAFDSYENKHDECLPGTRTELLCEIQEWAESPYGKCIFWLNGMAGTGKSTISRTVAKILKVNKLLGASFFFKRGEADRGTAKSLFPTLIEQLVISIPQLTPHIQTAIKDDPNISEKVVREQFEKLILQPLLKIEQGLTTTIVIVIDALDECEQEDDIRVILRILPQVQKLNSLRLRFLLSSRPDLPLRLGFKSIISDHQDLILHEIAEPIIERDISLFLNDKLPKIREEYFELGRELSPDWPGDKVTMTLVKMSVPLFIFAATVCRILQDRQWLPEDSLREILSHQNDKSGLSGTYLPVLNRLLINQTGTKKQQLIKEYREVIGAVLMLEASLSVVSLSKLIDMRIENIRIRLDSLHAVLAVPNNNTDPVRLFHLSFRDFLLDSGTRDQTSLWIDKDEMHTSLTRQCLKVMQNGLRKNILSLPNDGILYSEMDELSMCISFYLPPELQYACRYWAHHLIQSQNPTTELVNAFSFLKEHLLHWIEAMSILGLLSEVIGVITRLQSVIQNDKNSEISHFLYDARRFIFRNRQIADSAPLQIYCAGLIFAPSDSIIRKVFFKESPNWIYQLPKVEKFWNADVQTLEGHPSSVESVAFSPDGQVLASGGYEIISLWDPTTGKLRQTLEAHSDWIQCVAFSKDGILASASFDKTIKLWDPISGELQQILEGHSDKVQSVAFSKDGMLASASIDATVKIWDPAAGELKQTLIGHSVWVNCVAFSEDGMLASCSEDTTIRLWDPTTGELLRILEGHSGGVESVAFSIDGMLASGADDMTVKLWDPITGELKHTLKGHSDFILSVIFSLDGQMLASSGDDETIRLWDPTTGEPLQVLYGHTSSVPSVAFSKDGMLASVSEDRTVKLWDPIISGLRQTKGNSVWEQQRNLNTAQDKVISLTFSSDGQILASGSTKDNIQLWDPITGEPWQTLKGQYSRVLSVTFSPDDQMLVSGCSYNTIKLWEPIIGELRQTKCHSSWRLRKILEDHSGDVSSVTFSPDGQMLVSGSNDKTIKFWNPITGELQRTLEGHSNRIRAVKFLPDGHMLASRCVDDIIKLWDPTTGELRQTLEGHSRWMWSEPNDEVSIQDKQWVCFRGEKKLWLPLEYRPTSYTIKDGFLAIGHDSGRVSFLGIGKRREIHDLPGVHVRPPRPLPRAASPLSSHPKSVPENFI